MNKPEMVIFDWGGTLADGRFNGLEGTRAVLEKAYNPDGVTAEEVQQFAETMNSEFGRFFGYNESEPLTEVHQYPFQNYLYEYFGVSFDISNEEIEEIFLNAAFPVHNTEGIEDFLRFLKSQSIRTGVISNLTFSGKALIKRINALLPDNSFEFIIASSEYVFRKPHGRIFELALRKAGLSAEKVWYCGDNVYCDVLGAHNAGLTPVWYKGAVQGSQAAPSVYCIEVSSWKSLTEYIESLSKNSVLI